MASGQSVTVQHWANVGVMAAQRIMLWACITSALGTPHPYRICSYIRLCKSDYTQGMPGTILRPELYLQDLWHILPPDACTVYRRCHLVYIRRADVLTLGGELKPRCLIPTRWREMASFVPNQF